MFSSQLLRILQTIPSDVKYDSCVFDTAEQDTIMKENPNATFYDVKSFGALDDSKEIYPSNDSKSDSSLLTNNVKSGEKGWNPFVDDFSMDNENETINTPRKDSEEKDAESLSSAMKDKDKMREPERLIHIEEFTRFSENLPGDSSLPCIPASELSTDEKVLDCELPELMVCYKEINYHIVKDICVDEGLPVKDKISIREDQFGHSFTELPGDNSQQNASKGGANVEFFVSDSLATSSMENSKAVDEFVRKEESKEESYGNLIAQGMSNSLPENSLDKDIAEHCDSVDAVQQTGETDCSSNASKEDSIIDKTLPIEEFGTRSFLRSFISSLDNEEDKVVQLPDQTPSGKEVAGNQTASSTERESEEDIQATSLSGTVNSNLNSPAQVVNGMSTGKTEDAKDLSVDSVISEHDRESENAEKDNSIEPHNKSLNIKDGNCNDSSSITGVQCISNQEQSDSDSVSVEGKISPNNDGEVVDRNVPRLVSHLQRDDGESSFSGADLITYSGPIANSGSLSLRSDGSATSGRSFAFPILQSEWNSSPVRMAKADRKRFRKHKGWRSGLLCCRF